MRTRDAGWECKQLGVRPHWPNKKLSVAGHPENTGPMSLFRTKSIEQSMADMVEPGRELKRTLSTFDLMILGVAVAVGAGIFSVGAKAAGSFAGPAVTLSFI